MQSGLDNDVSSFENYLKVFGGGAKREKKVGDVSEGAENEILGEAAFVDIQPYAA